MFRRHNSQLTGTVLPVLFTKGVSWFVSLSIRPFVNFTTKFCVKPLLIAHISVITY